MLGNSEKMVLLSPTSNEWPQNQQLDDQKGLMASSTGTRVMEKPSQDQLQQQQPLKCPRCDSSNTKFCYYNNYSLSQPRHFCKACKRYWTRGGTLRNVPVGGGCRKNKRVKRTAAVDGASSSSSSTFTSTTNPTVQPQIDLSSTSNHFNPLFYGLPTNPSELNLPFSGLNSRVLNVDAVSGYDLQTQLSGLGLGFSSSGLMANGHRSQSNYRNGFDPIKQIQDVVTSNPLLSSCYPIFGSSTSSPTMASLMPSGLQNQALLSGGLKDVRTSGSFQGLPPYEDLQMPMKEVTMELGSQNRVDWNIPASCQNQIDQQNIGSSSDPSLLWNSSSASAWLDPTNMGSSVPSLI